MPTTQPLSSSAQWLSAYVATAALLLSLTLAWLQWLNSRKTFRLNLYDRRWKIYASAENILRVVAFAHGLPDEIGRFRTYQTEITEDSFLLPPAAKKALESVRQLVDDTYNRNVDYQSIAYGGDQTQKLAFETWNSSVKPGELEGVRAELKTAFQKCIDFTDI